MLRRPVQLSRSKAFFHNQYHHVKISASDVVKGDCDCYCEHINGRLPSQKQLDHNVKLPKVLPNYGKHVLLISPRDQSVDCPEWKSSWQSKLELNPEWPYSSIAPLKEYLKASKSGSEVLVNAVSMVQGVIDPPEKNDDRLHFYVIPDMKLYKITENEIERFANYLGGGSALTGRKKVLGTFEQFLHGANNVHTTSSVDTSISSPKEYTFRTDNIMKDLVLICGHHQRDPRCGVIGEDLVKEIKSKELFKDKNIGLVSHIGGHKFAGNMIFYNQVGINESKKNKIDCLWFGRVLPPNLHVLLEHLKIGNIPEEFYRGGLQMN